MTRLDVNRDRVRDLRLEPLGHALVVVVVSGRASGRQGTLRETLGKRDVLVLERGEAVEVAPLGVVTLVAVDLWLESR
jgi:hypothetical protein